MIGVQETVLPAGLNVSVYVLALPLGCELRPCAAQPESTTEEVLEVD